MRLTAVRIKNFRGYRDEVTVTFDDIGLHPNPSEQCHVGMKTHSVLEKPYGEVGAAVQEAMQSITLDCQRSPVAATQ